MLTSKRGFGLLLGAVLCCGLPAVPAAARAADAPAVDVEALRKRVRSGAEAEVLAALAEIAKSKAPEAVPIVNGLLRRGGTVKILVAACETAGKLGSESSSAALSPYVRHREESVRRQAIRALLKTKGSAAVDSMRKGLRSSDAVVRGISATGLGALGAKDALPDLFIALDRGVSESAASIGQLCEPKQCERFGEKVGKIPFDIMSTGFDQILFRPATDMPDEEKIRIVGRLRELGTREVGKYLTDVAERWPKDWSDKVKQAIVSAAKAVGQGGG